MTQDLAVGDLLEHKFNYHVAKVTEVNHQFGWYQIEYLNGFKRRYNLASSHTNFVRLTNEQKADYLLKLEQMGITDFWME